MASILSSKNLSLYTIPAAWVVALAPHFYASQGLGAKFDQTQPRTYAKTISETQTLDATTKNKIIRCEGAQLNGFENIGLYASAIVAGNMAGLSNTLMNTVSGGYILSRIVYNYFYITGDTPGLAKIRSLSYLTGIGMIFTVFVKAGNVMRESLLAGAF